MPIRRVRLNSSNSRSSKEGQVAASKMEDRAYPVRKKREVKSGREGVEGGPAGGRDRKIKTLSRSFSIDPTISHRGGQGGRGDFFERDFGREGIKPTTLIALGGLKLISAADKIKFTILTTPASFSKAL